MAIGTPTPLRRFRKAKALTLEALSAQAGMTPGQLSRIERHGTTSLPTAIKLAELTGLPVQVFAEAESGQATAA